MWTEENPKTLLNFIRKTLWYKTVKIVDIGDGQSVSIDYKLKDGFANLDVLDDLANAFERAKNRLGKMPKAKRTVHNIISFTAEMCKILGI